MYTRVLLQLMQDSTHFGNLSSIEYWSTRLTLPSQKYQETLPPTAPVVCLSNQAAVNPASDWRKHLIRGAYHAGIRHGTHHHWKNDTSVCAGMNLERYKHISIIQYYYIIIFARETNPMLAHSERKSDPGKQAFPDPRGVAWLAFLSLATCVPQNTVELPHNVFPRKELYIAILHTLLQNLGFANPMGAVVSCFYHLSNILSIFSTASKTWSGLVWRWPRLVCRVLRPVGMLATTVVHHGYASVAKCSPLNLWMIHHGTAHECWGSPHDPSL